MAIATFVIYEKGASVIFFVLPGERVVVLDRKKGDRRPAIVLRADGTIKFEEDGLSMSEGLDELSVADINPQVRRRMAHTIGSVTAPEGFGAFAGRLQDLLESRDARPEQEKTPGDHWPFANTLR